MPFSPLFWLGGFPSKIDYRKKKKKKKNGHPYSNLSLQDLRCRGGLWGCGAVGGGCGVLRPGEPLPVPVRQPVCYEAAAPETFDTNVDPIFIQPELRGVSFFV